MKLLDVRDHLVTLYRAGVRYTTCLQGPPGIGKSAIVGQAARTLGIDFRAPPPLPVIDPLDLGGIGAVVGIDTANPRAVRLPFSDLIPADGAGIILFDDITTAPTLTQAALYSLVWERRVGSAKLGADWLIVTTANRDEDNAATNPIPTPLINRMEFLSVEPDIEGWESHMAELSRSPLVRAYINRSKMSLNQFKADIPGPFPSSRSWENCCILFEAYTPQLPPLEAIQGWIGAGEAVMLLPFCQAHHLLVAPDAVLADPINAPLPTDISALTVILTTLTTVASIDTIDAIVTYCRRAPIEMAFYCLRAIIDRDNAKHLTLDEKSAERRNYSHLINEPSMLAFIAEHGTLLSARRRTT